jgi:hypothetical protein
MARITSISEEVIYAAQGNIGHPGTSAQITAAQTRATADLNAHFGAGVTVASTAITAAR